MRPYKKPEHAAFISKHVHVSLIPSSSCTIHASDGTGNSAQNEHTIKYEISSLSIPASKIALSHAFFASS